MKKPVFALALAATCAACGSSTPNRSLPPVRVVDARTVEGCTFLTSITESKYSGILFAGSGLQKAQVKVVDAAAKAGATHLVWGSLNSGGVIQSATGSAYRCPA